MGLERITGIVIDTVKHSDKYNVVTLYTREYGRMTFLSSAGTGKTGKLRKARLMPLSVISSEVKLVANREIQFLGAVSPVVLWRDLYFNPFKSSLIIFLSEFLNKFLRQTVSDPGLWDYIYMSLQSLDATKRSVSNRHISFLIGLLPHAGIEPKLDVASDENREWFDMREGILTARYPGHGDIIGPPESGSIKGLMRITTYNCHAYRFSGLQRRKLLKEILHYYDVHYPGLSQLKSLGVLSEIFS